jgi:hypothetical protein
MGYRSCCKICVISGVGNIGTKKRVKDLKTALKLSLVGGLSGFLISHSKLSSRCEGNYTYLGLGVKQFAKLSETDL